MALIKQRHNDRTDVFASGKIMKDITVRKYKDRSGEDKIKVEFTLITDYMLPLDKRRDKPLNCTCFYGLAKYASRLQCGDIVQIWGFESTHTYEKDGEQRSWTTVMCDSVHKQEWAISKRAGDFDDDYTRIPKSDESSLPF